MPVKSAPQFRFMEAAAGGKLRGTGGPSPQVANEFLSKTPTGVKSRFAREDKFSNAFSKKKKKTVGVKDEEGTNPF